MTQLPPITHTAVTVYGKRLVADGAAASTIDRKTSSIKKFLGWAEKNGYIESSNIPSHHQVASSSWSYPGSTFAPPSHDASAGHGEVSADKSDPAWRDDKEDNIPAHHYARTGAFLIATGTTLLLLLFVVTKRDQVVRLVRNFAQTPTQTNKTSLLPSFPESPPAGRAGKSLDSGNGTPSPTPFPSQPSILSDNGIFSRNGPIKIEGTALTLSTGPFSNGNITIAPDAEGQLLIRSSTTSKNSIDIRNANLTTGDLIHANVGNNNTNYNFLSFTNGPNEKLRFQVDANGNTYIGGNATVQNKLLVNEIDSRTTGQPINLSSDLNFKTSGTITTTNGNLTLSPTSGVVNIPVSIQNLSNNNFGRVQIDSPTQINGDLLTRGISAHGFVQVDNGLAVTGNVTIANLNTAGAVVFTNGSGVLGISTQGSTGQCLTSGASGTPTWGPCANGQLWQLNSGALSPAQIVNDLNLGNIATASANISLRSSLNRGLAAMLINQTESQDILTASASGTTRFTLGNNGSITDTTTTTTGNALSLTASSLTTGNGIIITGPTSTGITGATSGGLSISSAVGSGGTSGQLVYLAPTFSASSPTTSYGINFLGTDSTSVANTDYGLAMNMTLTGNAAKAAVGVEPDITSTSTIADTIYSFLAQPIASGAISTGTRNLYGIATAPSASGANTGGTTNVYGANFSPQSTGSTTGSTSNVYGVYTNTTGTLTTNGTINQYGVYIANGTSSTTGTSTKYGLYVENPTGADTNYAIYTVGGNISLNLGSDATGDVWYRNSSGNVTRLGIGSAGQALTVSGGIPSWAGGSGGSGVSGFWQRNSGALSPANITDDLLVGVVATPSAATTDYFQVFGTGTTAGTASSSGNLTLGTNRTTAVIGTQRMIPLTIGSATTGPIQLSPKGTTGLFVDATGQVGINTTAPAALFSVGSSSQFQVNSSGNNETHLG